MLRDVSRGTGSDDREMDSAVIMLSFRGSRGPYVWGIWISEDRDLAPHSILMVDKALGIAESRSGYKRERERLSRER